MITRTDVHKEALVLFAVDEEGVFTFSEGAGLSILGLERGVIVGRSAFDVYREVPDVAENLRRALAGETFSAVVEVGDAVFDCRYEPIEDGDGAVTGAAGAAVYAGGPGESQERPAAPEDGRQGAGAREERVWFGELVEGSPDVVMVAEPDGRLRYVNPAIEGVLGYAPEEFLGLASDLAGLTAKIIYPEDRAYALRELAEALSGGTRRPVPVRARHKDGSWRHLEGHINNLSGDPAVGGIVFVSQDVTRRVRAEAEARTLNRRLEALVEERTARLKAVVAELEESEERFRITFDSAAVGMAHVSLDGAWLRVNDKLSEIVGYGREELLGLTFQEITHPDDLDADLRHVERMLKGEISEYSMEKRYIKKNGSRVWIQLSASLVRDGSGAPDFLVSVIEDVTERKLRELIPDGLTHREMQVLRHIVAGRTNRQISRDLIYSLGTVKLCVQRIISKLEVENRKQAATRAVEIGLVPPAVSTS